MKTNFSMSISITSLFLIVLLTVLIIGFWGVNQIYASHDVGGSGGVSVSNPVDIGTYLRLSDDKPVKAVYTSPAFLVNLLVRNIMIVGGMFVLILAILAGYSYLTKGKKGVEDAKYIATWGLVGFLIMFGAYWIVQIIKLITGADIIL